MSTDQVVAPTLSQRVTRMVPVAARSSVRRALARMRSPYPLRRPGGENIGVIYLVRSHLSISERILLYGLIRGARPERVLEVGTWEGASAVIIASALADNGSGRIVGVDPVERIRYPPRYFHGRFHHVVEASPEGLDAARQAAGGTFDFVHLDSINIYSQVRADLSAVLPLLSPNAFILVNNPFHFGVDRAVREIVEKNPELHDAGFIGQEISVTVTPDAAYQGYRLLRWGDPLMDPRSRIAAEFSGAGLPVPEYADEIVDHDVWFCSEVSSCPRCARRNLGTAP